MSAGFASAGRVKGEVCENSKLGRRTHAMMYCFRELWSIHAEPYVKLTECSRTKSIAILLNGPKWLKLRNKLDPPDSNFETGARTWWANAFQVILV